MRFQTDTPIIFIAVISFTLSRTIGPKQRRNASQYANTAFMRSRFTPTSLRYAYYLLACILPSHLIQDSTRSVVCATGLSHHTAGQLCRFDDSFLPRADPGSRVHARLPSQLRRTRGPETQPAAKSVRREGASKEKTHVADTCGRRCT